MVILTSTGFTNPEVYELLLKSRGANYSNICVIVTGIPGKKSHPIVLNTVHFLREKIGEVCLLDVVTEDPSILVNYELIFILGGNSAHLFYHLKQSGAEKYIIDHVKKNKDIVGASAGAWYLSAGRSHSEDFGFLGIDEAYPHIVDSNGLNFIDAYLFPHYDMFSSKIDGLEEKLKEVEEKRGIEIVRLKNMDYIYKE